MFLFRNKSKPIAPNLREIAETTLRAMEHRYVYREGVVDEAVRRAAAVQGKEAIIDAIESAFHDYQCGPRLIGYVA